MTYSHSKPQQIGDHWIAVVSRHTARAHNAASNIFVLGQKQPLFVLVRRGADVVALDMSGSKVPADEITSICPQAIETLRRA